MNNSEPKKSAIEKTGEDLFNFAINRENVKIIMANLPQNADIKINTVEYELQILKIISVGWSISYYLEHSTQKTQLTEFYWKSVNEFSHNLSETTGLMIGQDIDYFEILKTRLDMYVDAVNKKTDAPEPAVVIGPEFAKICGNIDDVYTVMAGSRMFISVTTAVKDFLESIKLR